MRLLYQLATIENRFRSMGMLRFIQGHAYPVPEDDLKRWLQSQVGRVPRHRSGPRERFGRVFREGALL